MCHVKKWDVPLGVRSKLKSARKKKKSQVKCQEYLEPQENEPEERYVALTKKKTCYMIPKAIGCLPLRDD